MPEDPATIDKERFPDIRLSGCRTNAQVAHSFPDIPVTPADPASRRPKALGYLRTDLSGTHALRHTAALHRHARALGYQYIYTIHPPEHLDDPLGYALGIAAALAIDTLIIYDLSHVDDHPARACNTVDLETVCPPTTWARVSDPATEHDRTAPEAPGEYLEGTHCPTECRAGSIDSSVCDIRSLDPDGCDLRSVRLVVCHI